MCTQYVIHTCSICGTKGKISLGLVMLISLHAEWEVKTTIGEATMGFQGAKGLGVFRRTPEYLVHGYIYGEIPKTPVIYVFFKNNYDPTIHRNLFYYPTLFCFNITKNYPHLHKITITRTNVTKQPTEASPPCLLRTQRYTVPYQT